LLTALLNWISNAMSLPVRLDGMVSRWILSGLTAYIVSRFFGTWLINALKRKNVIEDTHQPDHAALNAIQSQKTDVPTMGGLMIILGILIATLLWNDIASSHVWIGLICMGALGALGFADDYIKLTKKARGLTKTQKLVVQFIVGGIIGWLLVKFPANGTLASSSQRTSINFILFSLNLGVWYPLWAAFLIAATSNAVNITDGLDGLAGTTGLVVSISLGIITLITLNALNADASLISIGSVSLLCAATAGALLGFLKHNRHPAKIFMGDTGSLALGGIFAFAGLAAKAEVFLMITALVFFLNETTVFLQIMSFKLTRKRIFPITPIHHHFQVNLKWPEPRIVRMAFLISLASGIAALAVMGLVTT